MNSDSGQKGFHHLEMLIWLLVLFGLLAGFRFSHHFKVQPVQIQESQSLSHFWKQLNQAAIHNEKNVSVQEIKEFQNQFFQWAHVTQDPSNPWVLIKDNGQPAKVKGLECELRHYHPNQPFIRPVCEL